MMTRILISLVIGAGSLGACEVAKVAPDSGASDPDTLVDAALGQSDVGEETEPGEVTNDASLVDSTSSPAVTDVEGDTAVTLPDGDQMDAGADDDVAPPADAEKADADTVDTGTVAGDTGDGAATEPDLPADVAAPDDAVEDAADSDGAVGPDSGGSDTPPADTPPGDAGSDAIAACDPLAEPTCPGAATPGWQLADFQPASSGFETTYGLEAFTGHVVVLALLSGW